MSYSSELTKQRIIQCAKQEFLSAGFLGANLRLIARNANVTTGALYNHFKNKEMLFEQIINDFAVALLDMFNKEHQSVPHDMYFAKEEKRQSMESGSLKILDYIYDNLDEARLLFFYSNGTKFENFVDKLIEIEESASITALAKENFELTKVNKFLVHVLSTSGVNNMLEVVHHNLNRKDAIDYMNKIHRFYYAGTKEILTDPLQPQ